MNCNHSRICVLVYLNHYGSIEYLEPQELKGKDCSALAVPPNLGILMLRFPVRDATTYAATLQDRGVTLTSEVQTLMIDPYGKAKVFAIRSPEGAWLEFIELLD